ncbi:MULTISPECIES: serine/threonine-protein kinase [Kitasatospora]|uniref:Putative serine/threonine protein kinase n=1 Tax=Kitasatospora setae (strain ATCC 33774 / DSM 43861 / JCM 3304 / KCC A-0304 / NBRC 14216 / KM-6054) TaxID=452652 RepID=E4MZW0_KITSK|nr:MULTISPECIES: serine/threonine-protein kinase [Kitasatospora]BAJ30044.1 putative serine/threonine protein kinase [Kitasatospora setae KM-6054]
MQPLEPGDPRQLGDYRLLGRLGAGGMGAVYLGRTPGGRTVAVKAVQPALARDAQFRERFRQEVAAARRVGGSWTAPVLDADTEGELPWVATGFVAGPSLTDAVREHGPLPEPTVRLLGVGLAEALAHVHGLGLVHRDVKPSNVLLTLDGPRLIDFGIARALDESSGLTQTGHVVGSPGYMSPEQAQGQPAGPASDVFSLGAVLALAATGRPPFGDGVSGAVLLYRVLHEQPDLAALDYPLRTVILACMAKNPAARPTPGQLRDRLDPDHDAAGRLGRSNWLPADLAAAVGRTAVRLLDLETDGHPPSAAPSAPPSAPVHPPVQPPLPPAQPLAAQATQAGFGPADPAAFDPAAFGPPPKRPGRGRRIALLTAAALLLAGLGGYGVARLADNSGGSGGSGSAAATGAPGPAPEQSTPEPSGSASGSASDDPSDDPSEEPSDGPSTENVVPEAFVGMWRGDGAGSDKASTLEVVVNRGAIGERDGGSGWLKSKSGECRATWTLVKSAETRLNFTSELLSARGLQCGTGERQLDLQPDGTLRYGATGGAEGSGVVLHRVTP